MPSLDEFINKPKHDKPYELEELNGVRPCSQCELDVVGALWDPIELTMQWTCSNGHKNQFKVN